MNWLGLNLNYKILRAIVDVFTMVIDRLLTGVFYFANNTFDKSTLIFFKRYHTNYEMRKYYTLSIVSNYITQN